MARDRVKGPERHPNQNSVKETNSMKICRNWQESGSCRFGSDCRYKHSLIVEESIQFDGSSSRFDGSSSRFDGSLQDQLESKLSSLSLKETAQASLKVKETFEGQETVVKTKKILFLKKKNIDEPIAVNQSSSNDHQNGANQRQEQRQGKARNESQRNNATTPQRGGRKNQADLSHDWRRDRAETQRDRLLTPDKKQQTPRGKGKNTPSSSKKAFYPPHLSRDVILKGIADKVLLEGILRINKKNRHDGYVRFEGKDDVFIPGLNHQNRALDGDVVAVRLLEGEQLEKEIRIQTEKKVTRSKQNQERQCKVNLYEEEAEECDFTETRMYGTIVGILDSVTRNQQHVGVLSLDKPGTPEEEQSTEVGRFMWFKPNDKRVPYILIPSQVVPSEILRLKEEFPTTLYTAKITGWIDTSVYPIGSFTGKLGQMGELPIESEALLVSAGIYWEDFSEQVEASLVPTPWSIPEEEIAKRADLRKERIFSIDPPTARDLDDAVSIKSLGDGTFELGVHIADVSYFVIPGTALDKEAYNRATSVYLVQKVIPMLPRLLCEELCSLNAGVDRLAFSVFWKIDENAIVIGEPRFTRSVINSCAKLWYDHAQAVIEDRDWNLVNPVSLAGGWTEDQVQQDIKILFKLSQKLRAKRYESGALTLNSIKLWFKLDDVGNPIESGIYEQKEANKLIEEFMLLANMAVAKKISSCYPESSLLRRHPPPLMKSLEEVVSSLKKEGIELDVESAGSLHASLEAIQDPLKRQLSRYLLIKGMKRAEYFCTGSVDISTFSHYALNVPLYTHFTSPIRRYCDLVVHRLLDACLKGQDEPFKKSLIDDTSAQCNVRKFASKDAQDASMQLFLAAYMYSIQETCSPDGILADAYVNGVGTRAFDVIVPKFGIESRVWLEDSMDQGHIAGVQADVENQKLIVHWKRLQPVVEGDVEQKEESFSGVDSSLHLTQTIGMFDSVKVLIVTDMKKSPPTYKLFAVCPDDGKSSAVVVDQTNP